MDSMAPTGKFFSVMNPVFMFLTPFVPYYCAGIGFGTTDQKAPAIQGNKDKPSQGKASPPAPQLFRL